jgi:translation elongation factor EF-Ts
MACPVGEEVSPMQMLELIKVVRARTGVGPMDARKALTECGNDVERAVRYALDNRKGPKANKLQAGAIEAGTHQGRIAAMVEVRCGTDFVARTDEFRALCRELLLQALAGVGEGPLEEQEYVRDPSLEVGALIDECARKVGETIRVVRYVRWTL